MAVFKPFRAVRPKIEYCSRTLCPPYDVVTREEAALSHTDERSSSWYSLPTNILSPFC